MALQHPIPAPTARQEQRQAAMDHLTQVFSAERISVVELQRGILVGSPTLSLHT